MNENLLKNNIISPTSPYIKKFHDGYFFCEMGANQRRYYNEVKTQCSNKLKLDISNHGLRKSGMSLLECIFRLKRLCSSPIIANEFQYSTTESIKVDMCIIEIKKMLEKKKIIIVSENISTLDALERRMLSENIKFTRLDGSTNNDDWMNCILLFNSSDSGIDILLVSSKVLTGYKFPLTNYIIFFENILDEGREAYIIARAFNPKRIQKLIVTRLICRDTIEDRLIALYHKYALQSKARDIENDGIHRHINETDIEILFS